jgi:hypothetical protein
MKKGVLAFREPNRKAVDLCVVWLKQEIDSGEPFGLDDVEKVDTVLHFCDRSSVLITMGVLQNVLNEMEE